MTMMRSWILLACATVATTVDAFVVSPQYASHASALASKKKDQEVVQQKAFPVGTFVEFQEKNRIHVGKIESVEHTASGVARYSVTDSGGHTYMSIPDKAVLYSMPCPNSPSQADKLFEAFTRAQDSPTVTLQEQLDISPELLQMAWEEVAAEEDDVDNDANESSSSNNDHMMTPDELIELVHSHAASSIERYLAWKLLKTDMAHVFFKEIKDRGRVVSFKAKTEKAVEAAKQVFCRTHQDNEICFV